MATTATAKMDKVSRRIKTAFDAERLQETRLREQREAALQSPANAKLGEIVTLLERASELAAEWADEHGPECDCDFCRLHTADEDTADSLAILADDVAGVRWQASAAASMLSGLVLIPDEKPGETSATTTEPRHPCRARDWSSVNWYGTIYAFQDEQRAVLAELWEAMEDGRRWVTEAELLTAAGCEGTLRKLFKGHPAWGDMILPAAGLAFPRPWRKRF